MVIIIQKNLIAIKGFTVFDATAVFLLFSILKKK